MIPLSARGIAHGLAEELLGRVSRAPVMDSGERARTVRVLTDLDTEEPLGGYLAALASSSRKISGVPAVLGCATEHLADGDVVSITPTGHVRTLYRRRSRSNTLFATDRCNSLCVMCSQPPRDVDDSARPKEMIRLIELIDPATEELGISGGEPTLLGQGLLDVIAACRDRLPSTAVHVLSNGRRFCYGRYAQALGSVHHPDLMIGVPVYSDIEWQHDYIVQARGAFDETIIGLHNLARAGVAVEIRIVIHRDTFERLPSLAEYLYRNVPFAAHVAFMGLEVIGFAKANIRQLWVDPLDYADALEEAVLMLAASGMNVSIYNHQLCTVRPSLWNYCRASISDWKRDYAEECNECVVRERCGGFFSWNLQGHRSNGIRALRRDSEAVQVPPTQVAQTPNRCQSI